MGVYENSIATNITFSLKREVKGRGHLIVEHFGNFA